MFKQLKNKFTLIQVITISIVLMVSFSVVYGIVENESTLGAKHELDKISIQIRMNRFDINTSGEIKRELYFILVQRGNEYEVITNTNVEQDEVNEEILENSFEEDQVLEIEDNYWLTRQIKVDDVTYTVMLNVTKQLSLIHALRNTLIGVGLLVLSIMTLFSRYFASQAIKPIEDTYKKQEQFVSDAAHELRTPLAIINTNADVLMSDNTIKESKNGKWLKYIKEEVKAMNELTNDLLQLSTNDVGTIEEIHLSEMLESKLLTFEASTFEKGITINSKIDPDVVIDFSRKHINQLIKILLDNSIKYTADKNVSVRLKKDNKKTTLKVSNLSTELNQEDLDNLFDRFYRKEKSRANVNGKKSYGLGLSIAKSICKSHNAKLKADLNDNIVSFIITF